MTDAATPLLETFDSLPPQDQQEVLAKLLRRSAELPDAVLSDEQLTGLAEEQFQTLDAEETDAGESETE